MRNIFIYEINQSDNRNHLNDTIIIFLSGAGEGFAIFITKNFGVEAAPMNNWVCSYQGQTWTFDPTDDGSRRSGYEHNGSTYNDYLGYEVRRTPRGPDDGKGTAGSTGGN